MGARAAVRGGPPAAAGRPAAAVPARHARAALPDARRTAVRPLPHLGLGRQDERLGTRQPADGRPRLRRPGAGRLGHPVADPLRGHRPYYDRVEQLIGVTGGDDDSDSLPGSRYHLPPVRPALHGGDPDPRGRAPRHPERAHSPRRPDPAAQRTQRLPLLRRLRRRLPDRLLLQRHRLSPAARHRDRAAGDRLGRGRGAGDDRRRGPGLGRAVLRAPRAAPSATSGRARSWSPPRRWTPPASCSTRRRRVTRTGSATATTSSDATTASRSASTATASSRNSSAAATPTTTASAAATPTSPASTIASGGWTTCAASASRCG